MYDLFVENMTRNRYPSLLSFEINGSIYDCMVDMVSLLKM